MAGTAESTVNAGESNGCEAPRESWTTTRITVSVELNPLGVHGTIWGFVGPAAKDLMAWLAPPPNEYETLTWTGSPSGSETSKEMSWVFPPVQDVVAVGAWKDASGGLLTLVTQVPVFNVTTSSPYVNVPSLSAGIENWIVPLVCSDMKSPLSGTPFPLSSMKNPCGRKSSLVIVTSTWSP